MTKLWKHKKDKEKPEHFGYQILVPWIGELLCNKYSYCGRLTNPRAE